MDRASWRELAVVGAALLVPVPLLAAGGLRLPLPAAIERGVASLTPGGGPEVAVVGAAQARSPTRPTVTSAITEDRATSEAARSSPSSTPGTRSKGDVAGDDPTRESGSGSDTPTVPNGDADAPAEPGGSDAPADDNVPGGDTGGADRPSYPTAEPPDRAPSEASDAVAAHAEVASVEITADTEGLEVTTGGEGNAVPDLSLPAPAPPLLP